MCGGLATVLHHSSGEQTLSHFYHIHSRFQEGVALVVEALRAIEQAPPSDARQQAWASVSALLGWLYIRNTQFVEANALLQESLLFHRQNDHSPALGFGTDRRLSLSILAMLNGHYGKLGVANRTQAVAEARRLKLIV